MELRTTLETRSTTESGRLIPYQLPFGHQAGPAHEVHRATWATASRFHVTAQMIRGLLEYRDRFHAEEFTPRGFRTTMEVAAAPSAELQAALADLNGVIEEAHDEEYPAPSRETVELAERVLRGMYRLRPYRFEVYPTEDGEVTILAPGQPGSSVRVLCHATQGVLCLVNLDGRQCRRAVYKPVATTALPDGFIREALADLGRIR